MWGRIIDCTIIAKREIVNAWFTSMRFEGCRFSGRLSGVGFGQRVGVDRWWGHGGIENCDFSEARLDQCSFHGCDMKTIRLPTWPCFTIVDPLKHGPELVSVPWPGDFFPVILEGANSEREDTAAVTIYAPADRRSSRRPWSGSTASCGEHVP